MSPRNDSSDREPHHDEAGAANQNTVVPDGTGVKPKGYVHPDAATLFSSCPWARHIPVFGEATEGYGPKAVIALGGSYLLCKGLADQILRGQTFAMMRKRYKISSQRYQRLSPIASMGWSIKALAAMMCDGFAFLGYTKRWYMFISCVGGAVFALVYGLLPAKQSSADTACAFIFLTCFGKANVDILSEGHYSRLMRENPTPGPALVSWIWFWISIGGLIATAFNGPLADAGKPQISIFVSAGLQFVTGAFYLFNWYGEKTNRVQRSEDALFILDETRRERERLGLEAPQSADAAAGKKAHPEHSHSDHDAEEAVQNALRDDLVQNNDEDYNDSEAMAHGEVYYGKPPVPCLFGIFEINTEVITNNWRIFVYSVVMTCAVVAMLCANMLADTLGLLIICVIVSTICCSCSFWALPLIIAKANVFGYLQMAVGISVGSPVTTFYMNTNECPGDYPNFDFTFMSTITGVIGSVAGLFGVVFFNFIFAKHSYHLTFVVTTLLQVVASVFDIIIVKRWNEYIGIPDHAMYIWGDAIVQQVIGMLAWMPMVVLLSRLCPRGSESVVYALMAGFSNLGQTTASSIGAIILEYGWPVFSDDDPCNHENLPWLMFTCGIMVPLLAIPLNFMLIPKARICDEIDIDGNVVRRMVGEGVVAAAEADSETGSSASRGNPNSAKGDERAGKARA